MSEDTTPLTVPDEIHPVIKNSSEFSDRLSPMLVKELRQGLKGYGFMILFIAMQAILAFYIFGAAFASSYDDTGNQISTIVFFLLSMVTLIAQPLRGMSAISAEVKENTIELMVMTKLSAWRIVFGKWISIVSQSALIIIAVAPYLIVRYFFGGMQLFPEIMVLISIFILSASFTAITVGLSAIPSFLLRGIASAGIAITVYTVSTHMFDSRGSYQELLDICGFATAIHTSVYSLILISAIYLGWLALDFGASYIAPVAENRATPRRLIALLLILLTACIFLFAPANMMVALPIIIGLLAIPICIISLTESSFLLPNVSASFISRSPIVSLSRYLLYPGWQSGIWYSLLLYLITIISISLVPPHDRMPFYSFITITFSCIVFPLTISKLFFAKKHHLFTSYIIVLLASAVLFIITIFVIDITKVDKIALFMSWIPTNQYFLFFESLRTYPVHPFVSNSTKFVFILSLISLSLNWIICLICSLSEWKSVRKTEQIAKSMLSNIPKESP